MNRFSKGHLNLVIKQALTSVKGGGAILGVVILLITFTTNVSQARDWPVYDTGVNGRFSDDIETNYIDGLRAMTRELVSVAMYQVKLIGMFFDAEQQRDTQRTYNRLTAQANKDYHPSDLMCRFGTFTRSLARADAKMQADAQGLNRALMMSFTNLTGSATATGGEADARDRLNKFKSSFCNKADNNGTLNIMCDGGGGGTNTDVDYQTVLLSPLTLDVSYAQGGGGSDQSGVYALGRHLYNPLAIGHAGDKEEMYDKRFVLQQARQLVGMQNVAVNSFASIVAEKAQSPSELGDKSGPAHMKAMMREFGMSDDDIESMLGASPSYYAQMDVLTKKMFQNPNFYTNLYDKPANVARISTSMEAIKIMQLRDMYRASLRKEMLLSVLISRALIKPEADTLSKLGSL